MDRKFTFAELADIHLCYGEAKRNAAEARRIYCKRFPDRVTPNRKTFVRVDQRIRDTGMVTSNRTGGRNQRDANLDDRVLRRIEEDPTASTRQIAIMEGVSHKTVWNILKYNKMYPYHYQRVQEFEKGDCDQRKNFCIWMLQKIQEDDTFLSCVLFTDEAVFNRRGQFNIHNEHVWETENPHALVQTHLQRQFSINVWAGIIDDKIIGPVILPEPLTGQSYLEFLQKQLPELLSDLPLCLRQDMWYMQDGASPHSTFAVRNYLNSTFHNKWIGKGGPVRWPARSPDLNPLDFFFWGHLKTLVYSTLIDTVEELQQRVMLTAGIIQNVITDFKQVRHNFKRRLQLCLQENGGYFEHHL